MPMAAGGRKALLAAHIAVSVGWIGALLAYLALDLQVATGEDAGRVRAAFVAMDVLVGRAIVPLAFSTLVTGIAISWGTRWGLFRHYWVVLSLGLTLVALLVLLLEWPTVARHAAIATTASDADVLQLPSTLPHSLGGLALLLVVLALNIYKPRGMTPYGWRKEHERR